MASRVMEDLFRPVSLGAVQLANRFVFPPIKLGYGNADGTVTDRQLLFYRQIAKAGPGVIILEPVSVTPEGREHPKQLCVHLPGSIAELKKIVDTIHNEDRLACLHLNHAGAAANPKVIGGKPRAPSAITCPTHGQGSVPLSLEEIETIIAGFKSAAQKAVEAGWAERTESFNPRSSEMQRRSRTFTAPHRPAIIWPAGTPSAFPLLSFHVSSHIDSELLDPAPDSHPGDAQEAGRLGLVSTRFD